jgi:hypothetical protein
LKQADNRGVAMSTKDDVSNFLQLGAKYELILTGLFDEITQQRVVIEEIQLGVRESQASLKQTLFDEIAQQRVVIEEIQLGVRESQTVLEQTSVDFQNAAVNLTKSLATQKKGYVLPIFLSLIGLASNLMIWIVKL